MRVLALSIASVLFAFGAVLAQTTASISSIVQNPATYDGQRVVVMGTVADLQEKTSHKGNAYDVFEVCSGGCLHVFIFGRPAISDGKRVTVRGTFSMTKHVGSYTFHNEIEADDGSL